MIDFDRIENNLKEDLEKVSRLRDSNLIDINEATHTMIDIEEELEAVRKYRPTHIIDYGNKL